MARKTKADAEITRQKLLDAAELLFYEKGVSNTSLCDIAAAAGVTRGAIYWHFENKADLFEAMHARVRLPLEEIEAEVLGKDDPLEALREFWTRSLIDVLEDERRRRVIDILFRKCEYVEDFAAASARIDEWSEQVIAVLIKAFQEAETRNLLGPGICPQGAACATYSLITGIVYSFAAKPNLLAQNQSVSYTLLMFFRSMYAKAADRA